MQKIPKIYNIHTYSWSEQIFSRVERDKKGWIQSKDCARVGIEDSLESDKTPLCSVSKMRKLTPKRKKGENCISYVCSSAVCTYTNFIDGVRHVVTVFEKRGIGLWVDCRICTFSKFEIETRSIDIKRRWLWLIFQNLVTIRVGTYIK